ncbi:BTB/POZ and MATH domain-containing protein 1-like [Phragmites australis]|uniref:BTB/POZ and MATH domain-containing protein 1-like n=1 Tax=Phragmites australis TaxID=29695 RepID=UPI002D7890A3|nr:BTB/POZ and MATH domain-containing protein 1-like [Phragmites australis]
MPTSKTVSTCTPDLEEGTHVFEILGYSKHRGMGNKFIRSGTFSVAGHDWTILFYPDGSRTDDLDYISVYLELMSQGSKVRASCDLRLVDQSTGLSSSVHRTGPRMFNSSDDSKYAPQTRLSKKRSELESSAYLQDDRLTIECIVTVFKEPYVSKTEFFSEIEVPQSDIMEHLGKLLEEKEGADVTFSVEGETVVAHKIVLAMRSPVFKAEFFGPMREARAQQVTIEDMQPAVFRALLHFIYTDSLPGTDGIWGAAADNEMIRHLLVAADRYAVDRLKVICQSILCRNLDVETVATTMALAYQHNCDRLKDVCLEFITRSNVMDAVVATQGYKNLKATCPSALVDAFEKTSMFRKT